MKKLVVPALLVAGLTLSVLVGATSVSWAQESAPSCAQAISTFLDAQKAFEKLPKRVERDVPNPALPGLRDAVATAKGALAEKVAAATAAGFPPADQTQAQLDRLRKIAEPGDSDPTPGGQTDAEENAEAAPKIAALEDVFEAQANLATAEAAFKAAPEKTRGQVPNPALTKGPELDALVKAQNDADKACQGQPGNPGPVNPTTPPTTTTPPNAGPEFATCSEANAAGVFNIPASSPNYRAALDSDSDGLACERLDDDSTTSVSPSVVTPVGGVETGGGPA